MNDRLNRLISQWGSPREVTPSAPSKPTAQCLTYEQADRIARDQAELSSQLREHLVSCEYCRRLLDDFTEAIAQGAPQAAPHRMIPRRMFTYLPRVAYVAAAASVLLVVGLAVFFSVRKPERPMLLASAEVGLQSQIESGLIPKGLQQFASGQVIMFRVNLLADCHLVLISLGPRGKVVALPPLASSGQLSHRFGQGAAKLGRYRLDENTGQETFFVVASQERILDLSSRLKELQRIYDSTTDPERLVRHIHTWPADVQVISFEHVSQGL